MNKNVLEFESLKKIYPLPNGKNLQALKDLTFQVRENEFFGFLGLNGAGKSTAINILGGISKPTSGDVKVFGHSAIKEPALVKSLIGIVPQEFAVDSFFKIKTLLKIQSKLQGVMPDNDWIDYLLEGLFLKDHLFKTSVQLSGGMKRRLMIVLALVHKPKILVLDEPTAGVDVDIRRSLWSFIREIHKHGTTVIITTHYLEEAEDLCDRIAIIKSGEIVSLEDRKNLLEKFSCSRVELNFTVTEKNKASLINLIQSKDTLGDLNFSFKKEDIKEGHVLELSYPYDPSDFKNFSQITNRVNKIGEDFNLEFLNIEPRKQRLEDIFLKLSQ